MSFASQIKANLEARNGLIEQVRSIHDTAEKEERSLDAAELETEDKLAGEISGIDERVARLADLADGEERSNELGAKFVTSTDDNASDEPKAFADLDVRSQFEHVIRSADGAPSSFEIQKRDEVNLGTTTSTDGPELVQNLYGALYEHMVEESPILQSGVTVMETSGGQQITLPKTTANSAATLVAEAAQIPTDSPQFGQATIGAHKIGFMVPVDAELIADDSYDIVSYVNRQGGRALGRGANTYFVTGAGGAAEPTGIDTASAATSSLSVGAPDLDALIDVVHEIIPSARVNSRWLLNDKVLAGVRKVKDANGNYLWQPSNIVGQPDTLHGYPVLTDPNLGDSAGDVVGMFGNFEGFHARIAGGFRMERSDHFGFDTDVVWFRFLTRIDSVILDDTSFRAINGAA